MNQSKSLIKRPSNKSKKSQQNNLPLLKAKNPIKSSRASKVEGGDLDPKIPTSLSSSPIPKSITAKSWAVYHRKTKQVIGTCNFKTRRQIASLTKIMTAKCVIEICSMLDISLQSTFFRITQSAASITGTVAQLEKYQWLSIQNLLYGMMLPSGNDAALALAENLGAILQFKKTGQLDEYREITSLDLTQSYQQIQDYTKTFIKYMNKKAKQLGMTGAHYMNPHGLDQIGHYGTCQDLLRLTINCLKDKVFKRIVEKQEHQCVARTYKNGAYHQRKIKWSNTNKLLGQNCNGMKTGQTPKAGGCLITTYSLSHYPSDVLVIVLLGCLGQQERFSDSKRLYKWGIKQLQEEGR